MRGILDNLSDTVETGLRELQKMEWNAIEDILRHHIENPIEGEITREKIKRAGVRCVVYDEEMHGEPVPAMRRKGDGMVFEMTSALIGIAQGDWLIAPGGIRRRLTEKEEAFLRRQEELEMMEEMGIKQKEDGV